jgi:uncharacterized protein YodC (DUF2158 family)
MTYYFISLFNFLKPIIILIEKGEVPPLDKINIIIGGFMSSFKVGDTVQLKSGGPIMTVSFLEEQDSRCFWFSKDDHRMEGIFPVETLKTASEPETGVYATRLSI